MAGDFGIGDPRTVYPRKFRWLFKVKNVIGDGLTALPPVKGSRPKISFKEVEAQHVNETVFFPGKPDWQSFTVQCLESRCRSEVGNSVGPVLPGNGAIFKPGPISCPPVHPLVGWYNSLYAPQTDTTDGYRFFINEDDPDKSLGREARLQLFDPCGRCLEQWVYETVWPQAVDFEDLDMGSSDVVMATVTFRYARAYTIGCDS